MSIAATSSDAHQPLRLGLRANAGQFVLLVLVNALVGAMVGLERSILPALATDELGVAASSALLSFVAFFGLTKAVTNYFAGALAERRGRRRILIAGWVVTLPVPFLLAFATSWPQVLAANALLGVGQGLSWSMTVVMKIDLAGRERRGLAMGLNEFAGYVAVALAAFAAGVLAVDLGVRTPLMLGAPIAVAGLLLSVLLVRETRDFARLEESTASEPPAPTRTMRERFVHTSLRDPDLSSACQAGLVNNANDGVVWGLLPGLALAAGLPLGEVGLVAAVYPLVWGVGQLGAGIASDTLGRRALIVAGMGVQAVGLAALALASTLTGFVTGATLLGAGTALVYPTLLAAVADAAPPAERAEAVGIYRLWRDLGYVVGALGAGLVADLTSPAIAFGVTALATALSGLLTAHRMQV